MNEFINKYIIKLKSPKILMIAGVVGIALIYLSTAFTSDKKAEVKNADSSSAMIEEYREKLENDICKMVSNITGSKKVTAVVTLENGIRYSYADMREEALTEKLESETKSSDKELKEGYITVKTADGGEQALLITEQMPEVRGVAIVCEGGDNEVLNEKIKNTVMAAFDITSKRVYICGGNR